MTIATRESLGVKTGKWYVAISGIPFAFGMATENVNADILQTLRVMSAAPENDILVSVKAILEQTENSLGVEFTEGAKKNPIADQYYQSKNSTSFSKLKIRITASDIPELFGNLNEPVATLLEPIIGDSGSNDCEVDVSAPTVFAVEDIIYIGLETFKITNINGATLTLNRAQAGSDADVHAIGDGIFLQPAFWVGRRIALVRGFVEEVGEQEIRWLGVVSSLPNCVWGNIFEIDTTSLDSLLRTPLNIAGAGVVTYSFLYHFPDGDILKNIVTDGGYWYGTEFPTYIHLGRCNICIRLVVQCDNENEFLTLTIKNILQVGENIVYIENIEQGVNQREWYLDIRVLARITTLGEGTIQDDDPALQSQSSWHIFSWALPAEFGLAGAGWYGVQTTDDLKITQDYDWHDTIEKSFLELTGKRIANLVLLRGQPLYYNDTEKNSLLMQVFKMKDGLGDYDNSACYNSLAVKDDWLDLTEIAEESEGTENINCGIILGWNGKSFTKFDIITQCILPVTGGVLIINEEGKFSLRRRGFEKALIHYLTGAGAVTSLNATSFDRSITPNENGGDLKAITSVTFKYKNVIFGRDNDAAPTITVNLPAAKIYDYSHHVNIDVDLSIAILDLVGNFSDDQAFVADICDTFQRLTERPLPSFTAEMAMKYHTIEVGDIIRLDCAGFPFYNYETGTRTGIIYYCEVLEKKLNLRQNTISFKFGAIVKASDLENRCLIAPSGMVESVDIYNYTVTLDNDYYSADDASMFKAGDKVTFYSPTHDAWSADVFTIKSVTGAIIEFEACDLEEITAGDILEYADYIEAKSIADTAVRDQMLEHGFLADDGASSVDNSPQGDEYLPSNEIGILDDPPYKIG